MRRILPVLGMIGLLTFTFALRAYIAQPVKALNPQQVITETLSAMPSPQALGTATAPPPLPSTPTSMPHAQPTQMNALPYGPKMGMGMGK